MGEPIEPRASERLRHVHRILYPWHRYPVFMGKQALQQEGLQRKECPLPRSHALCAYDFMRLRE